MNTSPSSNVTAPDLSGWLQHEGWRIERPCPCCPTPAASTFRAASPCGRLMLHAADPHETECRLYSLSPSAGLGGWVLTVPEELTGTVLAAALNALDHTPPVPAGTEHDQRVEGLDLLDLALSQLRREVITLCLRIDDCVDGISSEEKPEKDR
ncbi:hypothetical protein KDL01_09480 [Actinospica durhamensis]|uniref:Uncharacterized protein n=1 Tax=Actinospica durhamensis TaxID=1508375 RepID=A0A941ELU2_9ACTN|nr:hypothetical protein [Actinospica durhamensis]MBR7833496.1 hypothetical protein [Actinospica durhamensis]